MKTNNTPTTMNANEIPANVTFAEYTGETDFRNIVDTINVNGTEYGIRVRRMHGLNPANDGEYYVIYMPDEAKAEQLEAALKAAGHKATPDEYGVIVCTWEACRRAALLARCDRIHVGRLLCRDTNVINRLNNATNDYKRF